MGRPSLRLASLLIGLVLGLGMVAGRLVWVQGIASGRYEDLASQQRRSRIVLPPQRGSIYDRDGAELAMSMDVQTVFANPRFIPDPKAAAAALAPLLQQAPAEVQSKLQRKSGFVYLARKIDPGVAEQVKALGIPGVSLVAESKRFYPAGKLASHVLGFVGLDNNGLGGLEAGYEKLLSGRPGEMLMERDPSGTPIPAGTWRLRPSVPGEGLVLTLDREIQFAAETVVEKTVTAFSAEAASIVVLRPSTGEILAIANSPNFDPNDFAAAPEAARRNRAITDVYEPGSTSKVVTAAAALESNVIRPGDVLSVPDSLQIGSKTFTDYRPHPILDLTFADVIARSSNVGTLKVAQMLGRERLYTYLDKFGYGKPTGVDFPGEATGRLPRLDGWWATSMGTIPIGQGVAVTPLQMTQVFATVANGGVAVAPKLVLATVDAVGRKHATPPSPERGVIRPETARKLIEILVGVTEKKAGTGKLARIPGYQVAGKTGSADRINPGGGGYQGYVTSFIGLAPAGDPQLVVGVVIDNPSSHFGSVTAAPAFREVMQFALRHLGIGPGPVLPTEGTPLPAPVRSGGGTAPQEVSASGDAD